MTHTDISRRIFTLAMSIKYPIYPINDLNKVPILQIDNEENNLGKLKAQHHCANPFNGADCGPFLFLQLTLY